MALTSSAHLTCLCGAISASGTLLADAEIPILNEEMCHCSICRYTTGSLGIICPPLSSSPSPDTLSKLTAYNSSQVITRYFCFTCGCHCFLFNHKQNKWFCLGGIVEQSRVSRANNTPWPKDTVKASYHAFVHDTVDGGLAPLLLELGGRSIPTWSAGSQQPSQADLFDLSHPAVLCLPSEAVQAVPNPEMGTHVQAKCHCGGVSLTIERAAYKPTPEISVRHISSDPNRYLTYMCACRSCRLTTGTSLVPFTLIPPAKVFNGNPQTVNDDFSDSAPGRNLVAVLFGHATSNPNSNPGLTLKHYWSSPDVCRSFCSECGATISYWCGKRPDELDLAVGIFRCEEGSMGRNWLEWEWGRCSFVEECIDEEMAKAWSVSSNTMKEKEPSGNVTAEAHESGGSGSLI